MAELVEWHGWTRAQEPYTGEALHIGPLPGRKSICLYSIDYTNGAVMKVHAYFRSVEEAEDALSILDYIIRPVWKPGDHRG